MDSRQVEQQIPETHKSPILSHKDEENSPPFIVSRNPFKIPWYLLRIKTPDILLAHVAPWLENTRISLNKTSYYDRSRTQPPNTVYIKLFICRIGPVWCLSLPQPSPPYRCLLSMFRHDYRHLRLLYISTTYYCRYNFYGHSTITSD